MGGIIGIIIAVLALFLLVKVAGLIFKLIAVAVLIGVGVAAFLAIRGKIGGPR